MKIHKIILALSAFISMTMPIRADSITDGIADAGNAIHGYLPLAQAFGYAVTCIFGLFGALVIFHKIQSSAPDIRKHILAWCGSAVTMLCLTIALPQFFDYHESGGYGVGGGYGDGSMSGGDSYGTIMTDIPGITSSKWAPDIRYWMFETSNGTTITAEQYVSALFESSRGATDAETELNAYNNLNTQYQSQNLDYSTYNGLMNYLMTNGYFNNLPSNYY